MIREATTRDLPSLRTIQQTALAEPWPDLLEPAIAGPPLVLVTTAASTATAESTLVPDQIGPPSDEVTVGYAVAIPEGKTAYLAEFAIAATARRQGLGSALLSALCSRLAADGFERLRLTVRVEDEGARAFYDEQGFRVRSLIPHHYESGDGLVLVRSL